MESDLVSEEESADAHIERYPEINESDIYVEAVPGDKDVTDNIDEQSRNAEPDKERCFAQDEESRQP